MYKYLSLRVSLAIGIVAMGFLGIVLALYVGASYRGVAMENQRHAYEDIIRLRVGDNLKALINYSRELGQSVQNNAAFRENLKLTKARAVEEHLEEHFHQYFVTAGILKLHSLIALDPDLRFVATVVNKDEDAVNIGGISCARLDERARQRVGAERLKTISQICLHGGYPFMHVLIPIGGLHVVGYLEVVTDPTYSMISMEKSLGLPIRITLMDERAVYQSKNWHREEDNATIHASFIQKAGSGKDAFRIEMQRDISAYQSQLDQTRIVLAATAVLVTLLLAVAMLLLVKRTALDPIRNLTAHVGNIERDSSLLGDTLVIEGNKEVMELAAGFNQMTRELRTAYDELQHANDDLKQEIRERERAEIELKISRDHLEELVEKRTSDLAIARDAALNASRSKSRFLANMSHELRTPLNAIIGYTEIMLEDARVEGNKILEGDLRKVYSAGQHLLKLIRDILDLSKIEAGKMELVLEDFDVHMLVEDIVHTIRPEVESNGNRLVIDCPDNIGLMYADSIKLRQTLFNLLSNAAKFTQNGEITLTVKRNNDGKSDNYHFAVNDTGIGLSHDEVTKVFQAFTQADASTTRKYGGTGLGLAISRNYCLMMGGELTVKSEKGYGSTFTMILPAEVAEAKSGEAFLEGIGKIPNPAALRITRQPQQNGTKERRRHVSLVLIIDDDPSVCELVSRYLITKGYKTVTAANGEEGIKYAREIEPNVILLDVLMSGMDGWEVLTNLKQDAMLKEIPVVMMSIIDDKNMGYALGAADYIIKPIDKQRLFKVVNKCVRRKSVGPILLIKDDNDARLHMSEILSDDGWKVISANNNFIALDLARRETPSMVVLDSMTDGFDIEEYVNQLKQQTTTRSIPIIVIGDDESSARIHNMKDAFAEIITEDQQNVSLLMEKVFEIINRSVENKLPRKSDTVN